MLMQLNNILQELGSKIAMHVVAARPICLDKASVPSDVLEGEHA
jgi:translation elongation factor EF-Ts